MSVDAIEKKNHNKRHHVAKAQTFIFLHRLSSMFVDYTYLYFTQKIIEKAYF